MELPISSVMPGPVPNLGGRHGSMHVERMRVQVPPAHTLPPSAHTPLDDFTSAMAPVPHSNSLPQVGADPSVSFRQVRSLIYL